MHWFKQVVQGGHGLTIAVVIVVVGVGISWFSFNKISSLSKTPTRYQMFMQLNTEGCGEREFDLRGSIGSFGGSALSFQFVGEDGQVALGDGCFVVSVELESNIPLEISGLAARMRLLSTNGIRTSQYAEIAQELAGNHWPERLERFGASLDGDGLKVLQPFEAGERGVSFHKETARDERRDAGDNPVTYVYRIDFSNNWQPVDATFGFTLPESVRTYFQIYAQQLDRMPGSEDDSQFTRENPDITIEFRTDDVSVVRGTISDTGNAKGIDGGIRFGVENSDAESRRESGNVTYSAILGIGIALLTEALVIILALAISAGRSRRTVD